MPNPAYTPDGNAAGCSITYATSDGSSPSTHATLTISGTTLTANATSVNTSSVVSSYWTVTKTITVSLANSTGDVYISVSIQVYPCELTSTSIPTLDTPIGSRLEVSFSAHAYSHSVNSESVCGAPVYALTGGDTNYLTFDSSALTLTFFPTTTAY